MKVPDYANAVLLGADAFHVRQRELRPPILAVLPTSEGSELSRLARTVRTNKGRRHSAVVDDLGPEIRQPNLRIHGCI